MLLDRGATANAKPELEIYADDVKCAHGATVGELDAMQLFYAAARGLDPATARALLLEGFVGGLWDESPARTARSRPRRATRCGRRCGERARPQIDIRALDVRDQFPAIADWHYLDSAATAQKPQAVIDAIDQAYARDYATVHRGVYQRSAEMTAPLRGRARRGRGADRRAGRTSSSSPAARPRRSTSSRSACRRTAATGSCCRALEHHSNIVPWQLAGYADRRRAR